MIRKFQLFLLLCATLVVPNVVFAQACNLMYGPGNCTACAEIVDAWQSEIGYFGCTACGLRCRPQAPIKGLVSCENDEFNKVLLRKRLQYVIESDLPTVLAVAERNPAAALFLVLQTPTNSAIGQGHPVDIENGQSVSNWIATPEAIRLIWTGVKDQNVLASTFSPVGEGLHIHAQYVSTSLADGSIRLHFETFLRNSDNKVVRPIFSPIELRLGPTSRELDAPVPGRESEKLRAYPISRWMTLDATSTGRLFE